MDTAYLGLGSNLGSRRAHLQAAVDGLARAEGVHPVSVSPVYETEAHTIDPEEEQRAFLNAVLEVTVGVNAEQLLQTVQDIERREGRERTQEKTWAPRSLDIDLLVVGSRTCETDSLVLPHPRLAERRFVLQPWAEIAPNYRVPPPFDASVRALLDACSDTATIQQTTIPLTISRSSPPNEDRR